MRRRQALAAAGLAVAVGTGGAFGVGAFGRQAAADESGSDGPAGDGTASITVDTPTATVTRGQLSAERDFKATASFGDPWTAPTTATGTVTGSHDAGHVVGFGEELVRVDDRPVFLGEGDMPMYRELQKVDTRGRDENNQRLKLQSGPDVSQLQAFLVAAGHDADGKMEVDGVFGASTRTAVKAWQAEVGLSETGRVDAGQLVFHPEPVRVSTALKVGASFAGLEVTKAASSVLVDTSNRDRGALSVGTTVEVVLPDGSTHQGTVAEQQQVVGPDGSRIWRTSIDPSSSLPSDTSNLEVRVVDVLAEDALLVPVSALLALAEGGFAVEVVGTEIVGTEIESTEERQLIRVDVGDVLEGRAVIEGEVTEGTSVVIAP